MQPIFAHLVDIRHSAVYGNVYAISDMAVCLAMSVGKIFKNLNALNIIFAIDLSNSYAEICKAQHTFRSFGRRPSRVRSWI